MIESPPKSPEQLESKPQGMDAFPSLDEPAPTSEVRVTGFAGMEGDEDREKFESAFPDLSGEVPQEQVSQQSGLRFETEHGRARGTSGRD